MIFLKSEGIVINKFNYGEADRGLTIFMEDFGKLTSLIKGINKSKRRDKTAVDLLSITDFHFYKKNENIIITNFEAKNNLYAIQTNIETLNCAYYFISIINKILVENGINTKLYQLLKNSILYLNDLAIKNQTNGDYKKNILVLVLYFLFTVSKIEGINNLEYEIEKLNNINSEIEREMLMKLSFNDVKSIIQGSRYTDSNIIKLSEMLENHINECLEINLSFKGLVFGGSVC